MATLRPELTEERLALLPTSEARFYRACRSQLPDRVLVHHSVRTLNNRMVEGEADFVLFDPDCGMLVIEVKGGGVSYEPMTGEWHSIDRHGAKHLIKDPVRQASERMHDLCKLLLDSPRWKRQVNGRITSGYGVLLPDLSSAQVDRIKRTDIKRELLGCAANLDTIAAWIKKLFDAWRKPNEVGPGSMGVSIAKELFSQHFEVKPLLPALLKEEERLRIQLTYEQALILENLEGRSRLAIAGGAGTGKTLLAVEQSRRLVAAGRRTLLVCYNRALADHLREVCGDQPLIHPTTLHQLYEWWASVICKRTGRNFLQEANQQYPGRSRTDVQLPHAFLGCLDEFEPPPFDAVVVDEGQDFEDEDWLAVDVLLEKTRASLCIFYDHNQMLYRRSEYFPITDERDCFPLPRNCRNTRPIHGAAYRFYNGPSTREPRIEGEPIIHLEDSDLPAQARCIQKQVRILLAQGIAAEDIAVLVHGAAGGTQPFYQQLVGLPIGSGLSWAEGKHRLPQTILLESIARFKGLERTIIFLWIGHDVDAGTHREFLYVGMSRAKSRLFLVGTAEACRKAMTESRSGSSVPGATGSR